MANSPLIAFRLEERDNIRIRKMTADNNETLSDFIRTAIRNEINRRVVQERTAWNTDNNN